MPFQRLTIKLDGITASDYMAWVADPEPPALGRALQSVSVRYEPLGDTIVAELWWNCPVSPAHEAAPAAGLPLTPEVGAVTSHDDQLADVRKRTAVELRPAA